jgi:hypothetical protein
MRLVAAGLALAGVVTVLLLRDVQVVGHWTGQPLFSWGLVAAGCLCILLAMIPDSWVEKATGMEGKKAKHSR